MARNTAATVQTPGAAPAAPEKPADTAATVQTADGDGESNGAGQGDDSTDRGNVTDASPTASATAADPARITRAVLTPKGWLCPAPKTQDAR